MEHTEYDNKRTDFLNSYGFKVIRIWNNELNNLDAILKSIKFSKHNQKNFPSIQKLQQIKIKHLNSIL